MARLTQRRAENVSGDFYVDTTCIDCDTCRWMSPTVFAEVGDQSAVYHQPQTDAERLQAMQALLSCPTASIGTEVPPKDIKTVQHSFPIPIASGVSHCGYHAENSYGASSYFTFLFTGDHLAWSEELHHLYAFRRACWYSWPELIKSMHKLAEYSFEWVLPGHGRRFHGDRAMMQQCLDWMESVR